MNAKNLQLLSLLVGLAEEAVRVRRAEADPMTADHQETVEAGEAWLRSLRTEAQFRAALGVWDDANQDASLEARALFASWWFIENVPADAPDREETFAAVREIVRVAQSSPPKAQIFTLSTVHVSKETIRLLTCNSQVPMNFRRDNKGWIIPLFSDDYRDWNPDLLAIREVAERNGATWIMLDHDGPRIEGLSTHGW